MTEATAAEETTNEHVEPPEPFYGLAPEFEQFINDAIREIDERKENRKEINTGITSIYARVAKKGVSKKALKAVLAFLELNESDRAIFDKSYEAIRKAVGKPIQLTLFEEGVKREVQKRATKH